MREPVPTDPALIIRQKVIRLLISGVSEYWRDGLLEYRSDGVMEGWSDDQFRQLDAAIIDASSIIYARRVGILPCLSRMIRLFSTPETIAEAGEDAIGVSRLDCDTRLVSNDRKLVLCASRFEFAIISEDRQILATARREGICHFNTLMMLNFLLFVETIDDRAYDRYLEALRQIAWYGPEIWKFGENIRAVIGRGRQPPR